MKADPRIFPVLFFLFAFFIGFSANSQETKKENTEPIERVPVYPGCEEFTENEMLKKCMSIRISAYVAMKFNSDAMKNLIRGKEYRTIVNFLVDKKGKITDVSAKGPNSEMEKEAVRIIKKLPRMLPGEQEGKKVKVQYSLPIILKVP
ncbi:MAG TPA: energy transducer TonB [Flavobacteriaceae bacterium]|nr:energy transducer TonB [Flavobacteriaceae bacterium]